MLVNYTNILDDIGKRIILLTQEELKKYNLQNSNIYNEVTYEVSSSNDIYKLVIKFPDYAEFIDKGRKPGSRMPPQKPIEDWLKRKGINNKSSFAIRKSISVRGIKPRPFLDAVAKHILEMNKVLEEGTEKQISIYLDDIIKKIKT